MTRVPRFSCSRSIMGFWSARGIVTRKLWSQKSLPAATNSSSSACSASSARRRPLSVLWSPAPWSMRPSHITTQLRFTSSSSWAWLVVWSWYSSLISRRARLNRRSSWRIKRESWRRSWRLLVRYWHEKGAIDKKVQGRIHRWIESEEESKFQ